MRNPFAASLELERQKKNPFRILDLPAELRLLIYAHLFTDEDIEVDICAFAGPPITRATKLLRSESIPVFFEIARFFANVGCNWYHCQAGRKAWEIGCNLHEHGTISLKPCQGQLYVGSTPIWEVEQNMGSAIFARVSDHKAIVKNLTLRAAKMPITDDRATGNILSQWRLSRTSCQVSLAVKFLRDDSFPRLKNRDEGGMYAIVATSNRIKRAARSKATRDGFRGFSLEEIEHIAAQFLWTKPQILRLAETGSCEEQTGETDRSRHDVTPAVQYIGNLWASSG